ncbi:MAG: stage V sporulation protein AD [Syntrophaceticus sp.]|nr:stage V sporulation protein AD [Syntrophaceticus sp.]MDD3314961.1 stage V sporulation protein AD [Syntrophaceticus sp.]MDD4359740.1 stage V sporulation protein AD [Syntrophaceticus sp.]MDD4782782.1 stage V sporulation protein AD [Syntrophaceticus sp.]
MGTKIGQQSIGFSQPPVIACGANIVGPEEGEGPLASCFDWILDDTLFGEKTWEMAERKMLEESAKLALQQANLQPQDIDLFLAGDLMNQTISANFAARGLEIPFFGLFGACSTFIEAFLLGGMLVDGGFAQRVILGSSSHHLSSERQFRYPVEQGVQRPPTAQWTVTGSGVVLLEAQGEGPCLTQGTVGKVVDLGISDLNNMGAAMAPAAADTILTHFQDTGTGPDSYDLIVTGDLGSVGYDALVQLLKRRGCNPGNKLQDCGLLIYDLDRQDMHAGGSGCGCSATVFTGLFLQKLREKQYQSLLFVATGALMSPISCQQGETIPAIAHAIVVSSG